MAGGDLEQTLRFATDAARSETAEKEVLLVCGSFYIMEGVRKFFFAQEQSEADPATVNSN